MFSKKQIFCAKITRISFFARKFQYDFNEDYKKVLLLCLQLGIFSFKHLTIMYYKIDDRTNFASYFFEKRIIYEVTIPKKIIPFMSTELTIRE
jgi:hypothetical protein